MVIYAICCHSSQVEFMHFLSSNPPFCQNWGGVQVNFGNAKILIAPVLEIRFSEETLPATVSSVVWPSEKYQVNWDLYFHQKTSILGNCSQLILQQLQGPSQELDQDQHFLCKDEQMDHRRQNWLRCLWWKLVQCLGRLSLHLYLYHYLYLYSYLNCYLYLYLHLYRYLYLYIYLYIYL